MNYLINQLTLIADHMYKEGNSILFRKRWSSKLHLVLYKMCSFVFYLHFWLDVFPFHLHVQSSTQSLVHMH